jgi:hypothetical protein
MRDASDSLDIISRPVRNGRGLVGDYCLGLSSPAVGSSIDV